MPDASFFELTANDQGKALEVAAGRSGRPAYLLEKDVWVVLTLQALLNAAFGGDLTFKGGTSLSKAYGVIRRFSEDLDITYDIRALAPDLVGENEDPLPSTPAQASKWTRKIRGRLNEWVQNEAAPAIEAKLSRVSASAQVRTDREKVHVAYRPLFESPGYVGHEVLVEFGGRATGEPRERRTVVCDAEDFVPGVVFPSASPFVMLPERTFWEKATAMHVICEQRKIKGERLSRHWHDLVRLDDAGYAETALGDRGLAESVALHKSAFYREKDADGAWVNYEAAVSGSLRLTPDGVARAALADDYERMVDAGMLDDDAESFAELMARCADIEARANR